MKRRNFFFSSITKKNFPEPPTRLSQSSILHCIQIRKYSFKCILLLRGKLEKMLICVTFQSKQYTSSQKRPFHKNCLSNFGALRENKCYCERTKFVIFSIKRVFKITFKKLEKKTPFIIEDNL